MGPRNTRSASLLLVALIALSSLVSAQGVLTSGNTQLPACGQQCPLLMQAAAACGGTTSTTLTVWNCFCQSGYLKPLYQTPNGICDTTCTVASDNQDVMTWYKSNCGTDFGASEHTNAGAQTTTTASPATTTTATVSTAPTASGTASAGSGSVTNAGAAGNGSTNTTSGQTSWISTHYRWIIFIAVVVVGFALVIALAIWLKRRHERRQDRINGGFNAGVSERAPPMSVAAYNNSGTLASPASGSSSPARTRDAFMPYGYNYSHSDTRLASQTKISEAYHQSPLARGGTPVDDRLDDSEITVAGPSDKYGHERRQKRVLVRERRG